jgi:uncharacterized protein (TIGR02145 family)
MKKLITLILGITLFHSCSTSSDNNGNTTTTVVPVPPSNLTGTVTSTTQINIAWTDNSTSETGFKIERKTGTAAYVVIGNTSADITSFSNTGLTPGTTYTYRVYSYNSAGNSPTYTNELTLTTTPLATLPTLTTIAVSLITQTTASSGGNISNDGGAAITAKGVCWSTSTNPTISLTTKTTDGIGISAFASSITGLIANTTYYVRAYATNSIGISYGNEVSFTTTTPPAITVTDIDGNIYQTVTICNQIWTKTNLNVSKYRNGDLIPQVTDQTAWAALTTGAWCYYSNNTANGPVYGKLYNWYAVVDPRGLAPTGYHIPSDAEWTILTTCLGGEISAGPKMKETGTAHWISPNSGATNSSGFTGLPGGYRYESGQFGNLTFTGEWWSRTACVMPTCIATCSCSLSRYLNPDFAGGNIGIPASSNGKGFSIRCIKD